MSLHTNLMEKLDQASLRRFAFKVKFDYLSPDQSWEMFNQEYLRLGGGESVGVWENQIRSLRNLTPGDFAVTARQFNILGVQVTAGEMYRQLSEECRIKGGVTGKLELNTHRFPTNRYRVFPLVGSINIRKNH